MVTHMVRTNSIDTVSEQLHEISASLAQAKKDAAEAKDTANALCSANQLLVAEVKEAKESATLASSENAALKIQLEVQKPRKAISFTNKGMNSNSIPILILLTFLIKE